MGKRGNLWTSEQFKRGRESRYPQLNSNNRFHVLARMEVGTSNSEGIKKKNRKTVLKDNFERKRREKKWK